MIPLCRWDIEPMYCPNVESEKIYARFAATVDDIESFDNTLFKLSTVEAISMDPQSRILLEVAPSQLIALICFPTQV